MAPGVDEEVAELESSDSPPSQHGQPNTAVPAQMTRGQEEQVELTEEPGEDAEPGHSPETSA